MGNPTTSSMYLQHSLVTATRLPISITGATTSRLGSSPSITYS